MVVGNDMTRDRRVQREAMALADAGHEVRVYAVRAPGTAESEPLGAACIERVELAGWTAKGSGLAGAWRVVRWYGRFAPLVAAAARWRPDVLHAHDLDTVGPASRAARSLGVPLVFDDHEASKVDKLPALIPTDVVGLKLKILQAAVRWLARRGERLERAVRRRGLGGLITVSESLAGRLEERFGGPRAIVVRNVPVAREVERSDALRERLGIAAGDRIVIYHGTVTAGRGVEAAIRATARLGTGHAFVVLGWVWNPDPLRKLAETLRIADRVHLIDGVDEAEMFRLIAAADVALIPLEPTSEGHRYALPNKLFESMMAGLPIVASDVVEIARVLEETGAGVTYPASLTQSPDDIAAAIERVLADPEAARQMGAAGRQAARERYNWEVESQTLVGLYESLAQGRA